MKKPNIKIWNISNGWIVEFDNPNDKGKTELAFTYDEDTQEYNEKYCEVMKQLLYEVMEACWFTNSKHNSHRINIEIEKQI